MYVTCTYYFLNVIRQIEILKIYSLLDFKILFMKLFRTTNAVKTDKAYLHFVVIIL